VIQKVIGLAKMGDDLAIRLCVERMLAPRRERPVPLRLPRIDTDADAREAAAEVMDALGEGEVTPKEAEHLLRAIAGVAVIMQSTEVAARLQQIEERLAERAGDQAPRRIAAAS
jgi:hypothetical protein